MSYIANSGSGGSGSGTVNSGTANQIAYYATTDTAVSGDTRFTDDGFALTYTGATGLQLGGVGPIVYASANAQAISVLGNTPVSSGNGGNASLTAGDGAGGTNRGGNISIQGGQPVSTGTPGSVTIATGGPNSNGVSGAINLTVGSGNTGTSGSIICKTAGSSGIFQIGPTQTTAGHKSQIDMLVNGQGTFSQTPSATTTTWKFTWPTSAGIATQQLYTDGAGISRWGAATTVDLTAQSAAIAATTLYAVPAASGGMYKISWVAKVTTAATTSSTLGGTAGFQLIYTDLDDSVVVTTPAWWGGGNNGAAPTSAALNTTQTQAMGTFVVNAKSSTNIQYLIGYTSSGGTAMLYNLHIKCFAL